MKILIVGWYGTETIGDRGILASLIMHFSRVCKCEFTIASIYPFYTSRSIKEDANYISRISDMPLNEIEKIHIVDSRNYSQFKNAIKEADCVVMGGGPLDDMASMYMIQFAFKRAKKYKKKTLLYGVGLNVLNEKKYQASAKKILKYADRVIFRDLKSLEICSMIGIDVNDKYKVSIDPAVFSCIAFKKNNNHNNLQHYCSINLREFPSIYSSSGTMIDVDAKARDALYNLLFGKNNEVLFIPMNYFDVGIDDRIILNRFLLKYPEINAKVVKKPLTLEETFSVYMNSEYCVGMRFHAVVFQTLLNGNNYILDYTDPKIGKISGFIEQIGGVDFYKKRMIKLQNTCYNTKLSLYSYSFSYSEDLISEYEKIYLDCLREYYV